MPLQFNWFHGAGIGCFPSGHMTVFTAFGVAIWYSYPRCRRLTALGLVLLGMALIVTDYHFLSDVIAGAYVGLLLDHGIRHVLKRCGAKHWIAE
jgi:membrane-associated phospholipid phosphatase